MEVILTIFYFLLFLFLINKSSFYKIEGVKSWLPGLFFSLKCFSGVLLGLLYTYYYTNHQDADSFKFYTDSKILFDTLFVHPWDFFRMLTGIKGKDHDLLHYYMEMSAWLNTSPLYNDNKTMVRLNAFFRIFSMGHYYVHVILFNLISFTGLFCLYKTFIAYCKDKKIEMLLIFLMPSVLFWGSGVLKDGLLLAGFGILLYSFSGFLHAGITKRRIVFFLTGLTILVFTKAYVLILIIPGLVAWFLAHNKNWKKSLLLFISLYAVYFIFAFNLYRINDDYNVAALLFYKLKNFVELGVEKGATMINIPDYACSGTSILNYSPKAFFNTLFRPFISDAKGNPMIFLSVLENLVITFLIVLSALTFKPVPSSKIPFLLFNISFVIILFVLIGLITPILGAMVRYRIVALPSLIFILVSIYSKEKFLLLFAFLKSKEKLVPR